MAPKSIAVTSSAEDVIAALTAYADDIEMSALQNGTRVKLRRGNRSVGLNVYPSKGGGCRVVFDLPGSQQAEDIVSLLGGVASPADRRKSESTSVAPVLADASAWIGSDESGKGDYFGPLVVAAVALTRGQWPVLVELGVRDSKSIADARSSSLASEIRSAFPHEVITIMPPKYNQLWAKMGSVNKVLAWAHARAIENVAERAPDATAAVADQFGDESLIRNALFRKGRELQLVQMPRAEADPAVAAASILARAEFLRRLDQLGKQAGMRLPKGASSQVEAAARGLVAAKGRGSLDALAKTHFKTTSRVLG